MAEVKNLDFHYSEGWEKSGGKSHNVWGTVPFPPDLLKYLNEHKSTPAYIYDVKTGQRKQKFNNRPSVWTAYDEFIYSKFGKVESSELPRVSATFKSTFSKYGAVVENMGMKFAMALDMPTSYNEIVAFNPKEYPEIVKNYPNPEEVKKLQPIGIVSIDFLQNQKKKEEKGKAEFCNENGDVVEIDSISEIEGDELLSFRDTLHKYMAGGNNLGGEENLIENWISAVDEMAKKELKGCPREQVNKNISGIHSRIARAFLLREFLGDCDFTAYNGGIVFNRATKKMRYAPNHDYGESFNALTKIKLDFDPLCGMKQEDFDKLPENVKQTIINSKRKESDMSVSDVAKKWASDTSERNFYYVISNFPDASEEFFENVDKLMQGEEVDNIINSYTEMTLDGKPLLTNEEANMFKDYVVERSYHLSDLYVKHLQSNGMEVPQVVSSEMEQ